MNLALFYDTETTGFPVWKEPSDSPEQPYIVQLAALLVDLDTGHTVQSMNMIVQPDGWDIPDDVAEIHGITTEDAAAVGIPEPVVIRAFMEIWGNRMRVAHNQSFDARIVRIATKRYLDDAEIEAWKAGESECTGLLAKPIMQMPPKGRFGWKMPKLSEAYEHFVGEPMPAGSAHTAMGDTEACLAVYRAIREIAEDEEEQDGQ